MFGKAYAKILLQNKFEYLKQKKETEQSLLHLSPTIKTYQFSKFAAYFTQCDSKEILHLPLFAELFGFLYETSVHVTFINVLMIVQQSSNLFLNDSRKQLLAACKSNVKITFRD